MNIRVVVLTLGLILLAAMLATAAGADDSRTNAIPAYENHSLLIVPALSDDVMSQFIRGGFDVIRTLDDGSMEVVATSRDKENLIARYDAHVKIENMEEFYRSRLDPTKAMGGFHTHDEMVAELAALEAAYPTIARLDTIGYSYEGRAIYAFKLSDNVDVDEDEPEVQFNGLIHAREPMGLEICLTTINYLIDNQSDPEVAEIINSTEIWIVPCINPDGYIYNEMTNPFGGGMHRKNRRDNGDGSFGIDLNRNSGFKWAAYPNSTDDTYSLLYHGTGPFSEPETQVLRDFCLAHEFVFVVNYHSYGQVYFTPFGVANVFGCPDNSVYDGIITTNANIANYDIGPIAGPTGFGGDASCWQYAEQLDKRKSFSYLPETATSFWPPVEEMEEHCQRNLAANLQLIEDAHEMVNHPTWWLGTDLASVDSIISDCSEDFTESFVFRNSHETTPITISMSFNDYSSGLNWCTPHVFSGTINPGESVDVSFDLRPSTMFGLPDGSRVGGTLQLVVIAQDAQGTIDLLNYEVMMWYAADYDDGDSFMACEDNCPLNANEDQADFDGDGIGDICDNCWETPNSEQDDEDYDGYGDVCDICPGADDDRDDDGDGVPNGCDNCLTAENPDQLDSDGDSFGDMCDICEGFDDLIDTDEDGVPNGCDICEGFDDLADIDEDGVPDGCDNCPDLANANQTDLDENGIGDACQAVCGDTNGDGDPNVGDAVYMISYIFKSGPAPDPVCAGDANGDGNPNVGDAVYLITYVFNGGPAPVESCCATH